MIGNVYELNLKFMKWYEMKFELVTNSLFLTGEYWSGWGFPAICSAGVSPQPQPLLLELVDCLAWEVASFPQRSLEFGISGWDNLKKVAW